MSTATSQFENLVSQFDRAASENSNDDDPIQFIDRQSYHGNIVVASTTTNTTLSGGGGQTDQHSEQQQQQQSLSPDHHQHQSSSSASSLFPPNHHPHHGGHHVRSDTASSHETLQFEAAGTSKSSSVAATATTRPGTGMTNYHLSEGVVTPALLPTISSSGRGSATQNTTNYTTNYPHYATTSTATTTAAHKSVAAQPHSDGAAAAAATTTTSVPQQSSSSYSYAGYTTATVYQPSISSTAATGERVADDATTSTTNVVQIPALSLPHPTSSNNSAKYPTASSTMSTPSTTSYTTATTTTPTAATTTAVPATALRSVEETERKQNLEATINRMLNRFDTQKNHESAATRDAAATATPSPPPNHSNVNNQQHHSHSSVASYVSPPLASHHQHQQHNSISTHGGPHATNANDNDNDDDSAHSTRRQYYTTSASATNGGLVAATDEYTTTTIITTTRKSPAPGDSFASGGTGGGAGFESSRSYTYNNNNSNSNNNTNQQQNTNNTSDHHSTHGMMMNNKNMSALLVESPRKQQHQQQQHPTTGSSPVPPPPLPPFTSHTNTTDVSTTTTSINVVRHNGGAAAAAEAAGGGGYPYPATSLPTMHSVGQHDNNTATAYRNNNEVSSSAAGPPSSSSVPIPSLLPFSSSSRAGSRSSTTMTHTTHAVPNGVREDGTMDYSQMYSSGRNYAASNAQHRSRSDSRGRSATGRYHHQNTTTTTSTTSTPTISASYQQQYPTAVVDRSPQPQPQPQPSVSAAAQGGRPQSHRLSVSVGGNYLDNKSSKLRSRSAGATAVAQRSTPLKVGPDGASPAVKVMSSETKDRLLNQSTFTTEQKRTPRYENKMYDGKSPAGLRSRSAGASSNQPSTTATNNNNPTVDGATQRLWDDAQNKVEAHWIDPDTGLTRREQVDLLNAQNHTERMKKWRLPPGGKRTEGGPLSGISNECYYGSSTQAGAHNTSFGDGGRITSGNLYQISNPLPMPHGAGLYRHGGGSSTTAQDDGRLAQLKNVKSKVGDYLRHGTPIPHYTQKEGAGDGGGTLHEKVFAHDYKQRKDAPQKVSHTTSFVRSVRQDCKSFNELDKSSMNRASYVHEQQRVMQARASQGAARVPRAHTPRVFAMATEKQKRMQQQQKEVELREKEREERRRKALLTHAVQIRTVHQHQKQYRQQRWDEHQRSRSNSRSRSRTGSNPPGLNSQPNSPTRPVVVSSVTASASHSFDHVIGAAHGQTSSYPTSDERYRHEDEHQHDQHHAYHTDQQHHDSPPHQSAFQSAVTLAEVDVPPPVGSTTRLYYEQVGAGETFTQTQYGQSEPPAQAPLTAYMPMQTTTTDSGSEGSSSDPNMMQWA